MADDTKLIALVEANTKQFENALKRIERSTAQTFGKADQSVRRLETSLRASSTQLISIGKTFATAFGAGFLVGGFAQLPRLIGDVVHQAAGLVDLADKIGITTDALQELRFQADQNGSSAGELDAALEQFSKRIGLAATGSGELLKILTANGVALRDNAGNLRPLLDLLADYADLIKNTANDQDRNVLSLEAFGRAGDTLGLTFADGAEGIRRMREEAHRTNQVVGEEGLRALESYDDRLNELAGRWSTFWTEATVVALSALEAIGQGEHLLLDPLIEGAKESQLEVNELVAEIAELETRVAGLQGLAAGGFLPDVALDIRRLESLKARLDELRAARAADVAETKQQAADLASADRTKDDRVERTTIIPPRTGGGGGGGRDSAADKIRREKEAVAELITELQRELTLVGASEATYRISNALRQAGTAATEDQKARIAELVTQIVAEERAQDRLIDTLDEIRDAAGGALSSFNRSLRDGQGLAGGLKSALENVLDTVIRIAEQKAITSLFGAFGTAGGGFFGRLFGGTFASGGVLGAGRWGIAGEHGPEAIIGPARVIPAGAGNGRVQIEIVTRSEPSPLLISGIDARVRSGNAQLVKVMPSILADRRARGIA